MNRSLAVSHVQTRRALGARTPSELAVAARTGDEHALGELYRRTVRPARAAARNFCADADADDAVAEGFSRALARLDQLVDPAAVEAWLIRCVIRAAIDISCQRRRQPATAADELEARRERTLPPAESAADRAMSVIEHRDLASVLDQLQPGARLLLQLRYGAGLSVRHIAAALGRPDGTVRRQCFEARRMAAQHYLGRQLRPTGGDCGRAIDLLCQAPYRRLSDLAGRRLAEHLGGCGACRERQVELAALLAEMGVRGTRDRAA